MELLKWPTLQSDITSNELSSDSSGKTKPRLIICKPFHKVGGKKLYYDLHQGGKSLHFTSQLKSDDSSAWTTVVRTILNMMGNVQQSISNVRLVIQLGVVACVPFMALF